MSDVKKCRCLLGELDDAAMAQNIFDYIKNIPQELKTPEDIYKLRLAHCKACDNLINGMCRVCGCFVEVRAAKANQHCPRVEGALWAFPTALDQ